MRCVPQGWHQFCRFQSKCTSQALQCLKPQRPTVSFDQAHVGSVQASEVRQLLLRQSLCGASFPKAVTKASREVASAHLNCSKDRRRVELLNRQCATYAQVNPTPRATSRT